MTGRENKTGASYIPEDEHSCFTYTFRGSSQRNNPAGSRSGFSLCRVAAGTVTMWIESPENSQVPHHQDAHNYTDPWGIEGGLSCSRFVRHWPCCLLGQSEPYTGRHGAKDVLLVWLWGHIFREGPEEGTSCHASSFLYTSPNFFLIKIKLLQKFYCRQNSGSDLEWWMQ